jgi:Transposase IS66 family
LLTPELRRSIRDVGMDPIHQQRSISTVPIARPGVQLLTGKLQGHRSGRRLSRLRATQRWWRHSARSMLDSRQAQVLRCAAGHRLACRGGSAATHRRTLRDRDRDPRPDVSRAAERTPISSRWLWSCRCRPGFRCVRPSPTARRARRCHPLHLEPRGLLCRFLDDGRIELDTNTVERAIRPVTLGRKNHLFAGSDGVLIDGQPSARSSPPPSSTTSSPLPTSGTRSSAYPRTPNEAARRPAPLELAPASRCSSMTDVSDMDAYGECEAAALSFEGECAAPP